MTIIIRNVTCIKDFLISLKLNTWFSNMVYKIIFFFLLNIYKNIISKKYIFKKIIIKFFKGHAYFALKNNKK